MKRRFSTIFTITVAAVLISSIAYAAKKKLRPKSEPLAPDVTEVDLAADLLDAKGGHTYKSPQTGRTHTQGDDELIDLVMASNPGNNGSKKKSASPDDAAVR
ncbi:MAG: hypothetical protein WCD00_00305 [Desulfuromonadaceae bacterium]